MSAVEFVPASPDEQRDEWPPRIIPRTQNEGRYRTVGNLRILHRVMQEVTDRMWDALRCAQLELYQDESGGDDFIY